MPSLSSASTTNHSSPLQCAPVPTSATSPPMTKLGRQPASASINISIDVVVVLPCVPATATERACAQIAASIPRGAAPVTPASSAATQLDVAAGHGARRRDRVDARDVAAVVADPHRDACRAQAIEHGRARAGRSPTRRGPSRRAPGRSRSSPARPLRPRGIDRAGTGQWPAPAASLHARRRPCAGAVATCSISSARAPLRCTAPAASAAAPSALPGGRVAAQPGDLRSELAQACLRAGARRRPAR